MVETCEFYVCVLEVGKYFLFVQPQLGIFFSLRSETADLRMPTGNWQYEP